MSVMREPEIEYHWSVKCKRCGTASQGMAHNFGDASVAMANFTRRTCESAHFVERADTPSEEG